MRFEYHEGTNVVLGIVLAVVTGLPAFAANPERDAYFGETHVHTSWSLDAFALGNMLTNPDDAYKYFKGEPIKHPMGFEVKIDTPLDWAGVTDHSEYAGVVNLANEPGSAVSKLSVAPLHSGGCDTPEERPWELPAWSPPATRRGSSSAPA